ncbi:tail assembly chaperone [Gordonia phage Biskit]|uniref:Tail assembly chaperone n=1 Tax=Gordonia phage SketchMex TaxID=2250418 RepID=A0A345KQ12_9CAUD|nr:tail assembly chaperone [Gordonia phage SketchMex]UVK62055.1 tail assembly chaperone [Gordonia phage Biskit]
MAFEKFHHKLITGFDSDGEEIKERVTLPKFSAIPFGLIRKNRKLPQEEQFFALLEQVASEEDLEKMDKAPQSEMEKLMEAWQEDSGVELGGIRGLLELALHPKKGPALEADLIRNGTRLRWVGSEDFTWRDLKVFVEHADERDAITRVTHPENADWIGIQGRTNMLLATQADALNWLVWAKTRDGQKNRNQPEPIQRPGVEPSSKRTKGEAVPIDQFKEKMALLRARMKSSTAEEKVTRTSVRREREARGN